MYPSNVPHTPKSLSPHVSPVPIHTLPVSGISNCIPKLKVREETIDAMTAPFTPPVALP